MARRGPTSWAKETCHVARALGRRSPAPASIRCRSTSALFCLLWSFAFVAGKIGVTDCPPLILLTARFSLAGILILGITALRGEGGQLTWRDAAVFAVLGVANNALYLGLGYTGLKTVSAGLGGLIVSANPVFTAVLAAVFLGEALTWRKVTGLVLGIAGVGFIVWHRMSVGYRQPARHPVHAGVAGLDRGRHHPVQGAGAEGQPLGRQRRAESRRGIVLLPFAFTLSDVGDIVPSARLLGAFAFLVLGGSILAYLLWFHLLKVCGATAASAYHFLMPPLGMLFAFLVLGEHVEFRDLLGIVPVALGIYLVTRAGVERAACGTSIRLHACLLVQQHLEAGSPVGTFAAGFVVAAAGPGMADRKKSNSKTTPSKPGNDKPAAEGRARPSLSAFAIS